MNASEKIKTPTIIQGKQDFFIGFPSLDDIANDIHISFFNRIKLFLYIRVVLIYKFFATLFQHQAKMEQELAQELIQHQNHILKARGRDVERTDEFYLSDTEIDEFEQRGLLGPFDVISPEEAEALRQFAYRQHDNGTFARNSIFDAETVNILKDSGQWNLDYSGLYQTLRYKNLWDVLAAPQIAHRMASLLGKDVLCWRSQFFEKKPGAVGTFWHQNSVFRETGDSQKLFPPENVEPGMVQLTAWIALTDVTRKNGAMRMIPGSFTDSSIEFFYSFIQDHMLPYIASMEKVQIKDFLKLALFSTGSFPKAQAAFSSFYDRIDGLFSGMEIVDLEMKAGQAVIFSSLNMHASYANSNVDQTRLAFAGRYCNNDVKVFHNMMHGKLPTAAGPRKYDLSRLGLMQVHGGDHWVHNNIVPYGTLFEPRSAGNS